MNGRCRRRISTTLDWPSGRICRRGPKLTAELHLPDATHCFSGQAIHVEWTTRILQVGPSLNFRRSERVTTARESTAEPEQATTTRVCVGEMGAPYGTAEYCQLVESSPASTGSCPLIVSRGVGSIPLGTRGRSFASDLRRFRRVILARACRYDGRAEALAGAVARLNGKRAERCRPFVLLDDLVMFLTAGTPRSHLFPPTPRSAADRRSACRPPNSQPIRRASRMKAMPRGRSCRRRSIRPHAPIAAVVHAALDLLQPAHVDVAEHALRCRG